jgi:trans-aconitate methyltransferase
VAGERWEDYYAALEGRAARPLLVDALALIESLGLAVDLGSGDGTETRELLRRGWSVVAVDKK